MAPFRLRPCRDCKSLLNGRRTAPESHPCLLPIHRGTEPPNAPQLHRCLTCMALLSYMEVQPKWYLAQNF
jgi:hypothetical protein